MVLANLKSSPRELTPSPDIVLIDLPSQRPESYAFSVPLTSVYSLLVHPPSLSSWCKLFTNYCHFELSLMHSL